MDHIIMEYGIWLTAEFDRKSIEHFYKQSQHFFLGVLFDSSNWKIIISTFFSRFLSVSLSFSTLLWPVSSSLSLSHFIAALFNFFYCWINFKAFLPNMNSAAQCIVFYFNTLYALGGLICKIKV